MFDWNKWAQHRNDIKVGTVYFESTLNFDKPAGCALQLVGWFTGGSFCPPSEVSMVTATLNDLLDYQRRQRLVPLIPKIAHACKCEAATNRRVVLLARWAVNTYLRDWMNMAGFSLGRLGSNASLAEMQKRIENVNRKYEEYPCDLSDKENSILKWEMYSGMELFQVVVTMTRTVLPCDVFQSYVPMLMRSLSRVLMLAYAYPTRSISTEEALEIVFAEQGNRMEDHLLDTLTHMVAVKCQC